MLSRLNSYYLNIIKILSVEYKIGVYYMDCMEKRDQRKQKNCKETDNLYFKLYTDFGAKILNNLEEYSCDLLFLPGNSFISNELTTIEYNNIIFFPVPGRGGYLLNEYKDLGGVKVWVYAKNIFDEIVKTNKENEVVEELEIVEFIPPYQDYPALDFSNLEIDYLIAYPTHIFLKDRAKLMNLYCNMRKLLKSIPNDKKVYIKQHNVTDTGNIMFGSLDQSKILYYLSFPLLILKTLIKKMFGRETKLSDIFHNHKIIKAKYYIEKRATPLSEVTEYYNFNIEHFLPFVNEGVITGISTCMLNAYYNKLPIYNCDDQPLTSDLPNYHVIKNYYLPPCHGVLQFDPSNFNRVKKAEPKFDMLEMIKKELTSF